MVVREGVTEKVTTEQRQVCHIGVYVSRGSSW